MRRFRFSELTPIQLKELCTRNPLSEPFLIQKCREIFTQVRLRGDDALRDYTREFDQTELDGLRCTREELSAAWDEVPSEKRIALESAAANIRRFHEVQKFSEKEVYVQPGVCCWRESRPIESVGLYVPGGSAVLPSTALMLGIPAVIAGCRRVALCVAPRRNGSAPAAVLVAAQMAGVHEVLKIGGAQAIAAFAIGTQTIPRVDKILGPGGRIVQSAKLLASFEGVAIDMIAGPTEVLVIADEEADPEFVCADLVSQAEHGSDSQAILVSTSPPLIEAVLELLKIRFAALPRFELAQAALENSFALEVKSLEEAFEVANIYAPEHLILHIREPRAWVPHVRSAGSVFLGSWSPEVAGDYASGTNHTLPTSGLARAFSGVSVESYLKKISFQELTLEGLQGLAPCLGSMADLEGLEGHRRAVQIRLDKSLNQKGDAASRD
ncbi:MAG: histidinol dehydrogenase [Acidobacteria bacterium]|nr:histidinol dehydrogenase [Acidobacteriota bacterium]